MRNNITINLKNNAEQSLCVSSTAENENSIYIMAYADVDNLAVQIGGSTEIEPTAHDFMDYFYYFAIPSTYFPQAQGEMDMNIKFVSGTHISNTFTISFPTVRDGEMYVTKKNNYSYSVTYKQALTPEEISEGIINNAAEITNINDSISDIQDDISGIGADISDITEEIEAIPETIADEVVKAANMEGSWCYSRFMIVDFLETNFEAIDVYQPYQAVRNYIQIYENEIKVIEANISNSLTADYTDPNGQTLYWTSIDGADAYEFFTYTSPLLSSPDKRPDGATDAQFEELYKVKVRQATAEYIKATLGFPSNGQTGEPELVMGVGDQNGYGKLYIRKTTTEAQVIYTSQTEQGQERGITIKNDGLYQIRGLEEVKIPMLYVDDVQPATPEVGDLWFEPITQGGE
ncbi:MAG: hypothetical protein IJ736_05190 [Firmicutes bacterium]|nr:hypothetical protein [Bacillota bacterium]